MGVVIKGEFPDARYFSYNVYNDDTKSSLGSYTDFHLKPDHDAKNPFSGYAGAGNQKATYTIFVVPEGTKIKADNVLFFPNSLENVSILLRHYVAHWDIYGNKPLPTLAMINTQTEKISDAPPTVTVPKVSKETITHYLAPLVKHLGQRFLEDPIAILEQVKSRKENKKLRLDEIICRQVAAGAFEYFTDKGRLESFNLNPEGTYPNHDNFYLTMPVVRESDDILFVRF